MTFDIFLMGLLIISTLTGLVTEAVKEWLQDHGRGYRANALAGYVAIVLSVAVGTAYIILFGAKINAQMAVYLIALIFLSWLSAMLGYDKVLQTIMQLKTKGKGDIK